MLRTFSQLFSDWNWLWVPETMKRKYMNKLKNHSWDTSMGILTSGQTLGLHPSHRSSRTGQICLEGSKLRVTTLSLQQNCLRWGQNTAHGQCFPYTFTHELANFLGNMVQIWLALASEFLPAEVKAMTLPMGKRPFTRLNLPHKAHPRALFHSEKAENQHSFWRFVSFWILSQKLLNVSKAR